MADSDSGKDAGAGGGEAGLPPQAPAYDLRTGEPLNAPPEDVTPPSSDFTASDLAIWAPSTEPVEPEPGTRAATAPEVPSQAGPLGHSSPSVHSSPSGPAAYAPTPPPGFGGPAAYAPTPPHPASGGPAPTAHG